MNELHNMSVPPRTILRVGRQVLPGTRYSVNLLEALGRSSGERARARALHDLRARGVGYLLELLGPSHNAAKPIEAECAAAVAALRIPAQVGFFIDDESDDHGDARIPALAAVALLAARSGSLYLPGRFEPSLITFRPVTLFFPDTEDTQ